MKSHKTTKCGSCGAEIIWSITQTNKRMPVNATPTQHGNIYLVHRGDSTPPLAVHAKFSRPVGEVPKYKSHFATCPNASKHRKQPPPKKREAVKQKRTGDTPRQDGDQKKLRL